jgi:non-homologous end joining protein Ku
VLELIKQKQAGKPIVKTKGKTPSAAPVSNIIDLLKKRMEIEEKRGGKKTKVPSLVPDMPKRKKAKA